MPTIHQTQLFIKQWHNTQTDSSGQPYYHHLDSVLARLNDRWVVSEDAQHAALLHDILEDTDCTVDVLLRNGYSVRTIYYVQCLTRDPAITGNAAYLRYIRDYFTHYPTEVIKIKLADITDNVNPSRLKLLDEHQRTKLLDKYPPAQIYLESLLMMRQIP